MANYAGSPANFPRSNVIQDTLRPTSAEARNREAA